MPRYDAIPQQNVVVLQRRANGSQLLLNTLTQEEVLLEPPEGGEWYLDYDEDNAAFLYSDNDAIDPIPCDEKLAEMVCVGEDGEQYTVSQHDGHEPCVTKLKHLLQKHFLGHAHLQVSAVAAKLDIPVAWFTVPGPGGQCQWSLLDLYKQLQLGTGRAKALPGKWRQDGWAAWSRSLAGVGLEGALLKASPYEGEEGGGDAGRRVLNFPSVSTAGLLVLLSVWAFLPRSSGGLKESQCVEACRDVIKCFCRAIAKRTWRLWLFLDREVARQWPLNFEGQRPFQLCILQGGQVEVAALRRAVHDDQLSAAYWLEFLEDDCTEMELYSFWEKIVQEKHGEHSLWRQLVWMFAECLEFYGENSNSEAESGYPHFGIQVAGWLDGSDYHMEAKLGQYVVGMQETIGPAPMYVSMSTDKSRVHSMGLMNTGLVLPTNEAMWPPPQVRVGRRPVGDNGTPWVFGRVGISLFRAAMCRRPVGDNGTPQVVYFFDCFAFFDTGTQLGVLCCKRPPAHHPIQCSQVACVFLWTRLQMAQRWPRDGPGRAQRWPRGGPDMAQHGFDMAQAWAQKSPNMAPKCSQDVSPMASD